MNQPRKQKTEPVTVASPDACFHCGEPIPAGVSISAELDGVARPVCCNGCRAVAEAIRDYGLERFYQFRTGPSPRPETDAGVTATEASLYDDAGFQKGFVEHDDAGNSSVSLVLDNVTCPACCWLIESRLSGLDGVTDIRVNYSNNRARLGWDPERQSLSRILGVISALGYKAWPYSPDREQQRMETERKDRLRRLALAGLLGMQVMMIAVVLYSGDWSGMEPRYRAFFHWLSLLLTLPVVAYSGAPFFLRAWRDIRVRSPGMDVPVALGIGIAFLAGCRATLAGDGHVYFDSVVMFIFLLSLGRYLEFMARKKSVERIELLSRVLPAFATRLEAVNGGSREQLIPVARLEKGDRVLVRPGEVIPADGVVLDGVTTVNEAILTGESLPLRKAAGASVHGGSTNVDSPFSMRVQHVQQESLIARIHRLMERGREEKPPFVALADRIASRFILFVLASAALTALYWYRAEPSLWLPVTVSVLIVTCPCALSLAMPTAFASATGALMKRGVAVINPGILETAARSTHVVFDKTGTLTLGELKLEDVYPCADRGGDACLRLAAALERQSEHPLARAVASAAGAVTDTATDVKNHPGEGLAGRIGGRRYYLGSEDFIRTQTGLAAPAAAMTGGGRAMSWLADDDRVLAGFGFSDTLREDAAELIAALHAMGMATAVLSGDSEERVGEVTDALNIEHGWARQSPAGKLERIRALQGDGATVIMVGDGINDAPVLAAADVSVAMGGGTDLTRASADIVLLGNSLQSLHLLLRCSRRGMRVIRQNLVWALAYNLVALPAAAAGLVHPWMAAAGMSLSSLLVVFNSARLGRAGE